MQTRELLLTAAVILVPLIIAVVVTLWSLRQVQYRRKRWRPPDSRPEVANAAASAAVQRDEEAPS